MAAVNRDRVGNALLGIAAIALAGVIAGCGGSGGSSETLATSQGMLSAEAKAKASPTKVGVIWNPDFIQVTLLQGSSQLKSITFAVSEQVNEASLLAVPEIPGLMRLSPLGQTVLNPGAPISVPMELSVPATTAPGVYEGTVYLRSGMQTLPATLKVKVLVVQGSKD